MYLLLNIDQVKLNEIIFLDPSKNKIIRDGYFIKILYSNSYFTMNGIYIIFPICYSNLNRINNKYKITFLYENNKDVFEKIQTMEIDILNKLNIKKNPKYLFHEIFKNQTLLLSNIPKKSEEIILKISGIWETNYEFGLSYKFM